MPKNNGEKKTEKKFRVHVVRLSNWLIFLGIIFSGFTIFLSFWSRNDYADLMRDSQNYLSAEESAQNLQDASDFLTEESRLAVSLGDDTYIRNYCNEVMVTKRREEAINELQELVGESNPKAMKKLSRAMANSEELSKTEYHAMRLSAAATDLQEETLPDVLQAYTLTEEEKALAPAEQAQLALYLLNSREYAEAKDAIDQDISEAVDAIKKDMVGKLYDSKEDFRISSYLLLICIFLSTADLVGLGLALVYLMVRPTQRCIGAIEADTTMPESRTMEMNYLVNVYNDLYRKNASLQKNLRQKAEHDSLTGLLNRAAFDDFCTMFEENKKPIALLIVDLDNFKEINDNHGHQAGDFALARTAHLLQKSFRSEDYVFRYGGDEFVVMMSDITPEQKDTIARKLKYINRVLLNSDQESIPAFSLSAGVAFSAAGYSEEVFEQADEALYQTKQQGKGGYTFA